MIRGALFDLDDTLYPQSAWLDGAWGAVARRGAASGVPEEPFQDALVAIAAEGTDRGRIIDRALARVGRPDVPSGPLVEAFRAYTPTRLDPHPGVAAGLVALRARVPVGVVTDGDPRIQRAKLRLLGIELDAVVVSDELDRSRRKPDPAPFLAALEALQFDAGDVVFVGDRPAKDVAGATAVGMRTIRVRTGEWHDEPDDPRPWRTAPDAAAACRLLVDLVDGARLTARRR